MNVIASDVCVCACERVCRLGYPCPVYSNPADFFIKMLATINDDGASSKRVSGLRDAWAQYLSRYASSVKELTPDSISGDMTSNQLAAWRWFAQYYPGAVRGAGASLPHDREICLVCHESFQKLEPVSLVCAV